MPGEGGSDLDAIDAMVARIIDRASIPGRGGEPELAAQLVDVGPVDAAVAHSFAYSGTALAVSKGVTVERLVLIAPPLAYRAPGESAGGVSDVGRQRWRRIAAQLDFDPAVGELARDTYRAGPGPPRADWNLADGLADLATDLLLLASVDDERFDIVAARALAAQVPRCALVELAGLDHRADDRVDGAGMACGNFVDAPRS